jgi:hypothetical protein
VINEDKNFHSTAGGLFLSLYWPTILSRKTPLL